MMGAIRGEIFEDSKCRKKKTRIYSLGYYNEINVNKRKPKFDVYYILTNNG